MIGKVFSQTFRHWLHNLWHEKDEQISAVLVSLCKRATVG